MIGEINSSGSLLEEENDILWAINSISFDVTFLYYPDDNSGNMRYYSDGTVGDVVNIGDVKSYLLKKVHPDDLALLQNQILYADRLDENVRFEIRLQETGGRRYRWYSVRMRLMRTGTRSLYVGSANFIDNRKNREASLTTKARQDTFTGLLNKVATIENINAYIRENNDIDCAMIIFDIDDFKQYNDTMGHLFGDEVIKEVANLISRSFSHDSYVGRIGGDEFLVFIKDAADIGEVIERIETLEGYLGEITLGQNEPINITCSVGVSLYPDMGCDFDSLFRACDMALYYVKNNGKNNYAIYTDELYNEEVEHGSNAPNPISNSDSLTMTNFAFKLLNEAEDINSAINLLINKMRREYRIDAIYVDELKASQWATECTYEAISEGYPDRLGVITEFSHKSFIEALNTSDENGGYIVYNLKELSNGVPGNGAETIENAASQLQCPMKLFSESHGTVDFISRYGVSFWNRKKCNDLLAIVNILTVCLYCKKQIGVAEEKVSRYNEIDPLTGLMKEENFIVKATEIIRSKSSRSHVAVVYSDISNFKYINETYGYAMGDRILKDFADFIAHKVNGVLCAGRFYSDNIISVSRFEGDYSEDNIRETVDDLNEMLSQYLRKKYGVNGITINSGVYIVLDSKADAVQAISNANLARKLVKRTKSPGCILFNPDMFEKRKREIQYIQDIDDAIANEEFFVCLQPKVLGEEQKLVGAEALVRWRRPDGTMIYPDEFIPVFERSGAIIKLDFFVYEKVMQYIRKRLDEGKRVVPVSVNLSRVHLRTNDFVPRFKALLKKYAVPAEYLEIELTETVYLENIEVLDRSIDELRNLGIKVSMDDFGSGYSSLNALNDLKVDLIKIDRMFLRDENIKESDRTIIRFIIEMASNLSMQVLCEGVETDSQRRFLIDAGCDLHQGYLYSKPVEMPVFDEFIDKEDLLFARIS